MTLFRAVLLAMLLLARIAHAEPPVVAAAADLGGALPEIAALYTKQSGHALRLVFGSSGNFTQQIVNGAPFALFLSADESYVAQLHAKRLTRDAGRRYATGRIALFIPRGSRLKADPGLADLKAALADGRLTRFAIANPEHAPYGHAAREALERAGAWTAIQPRLVLGENAAQAMQFAASGSADGGIVALSLALSPEASGRGTSVALPQASHAPLRQRMVLLRNAGPEAAGFYAFLQTSAAQAILARHGFAPPDED
jgi:molybdate transport system substrate-binding protein